MNRKGIFLTFMVFLLLSTILALNLSMSQTEIKQQRNTIDKTAFRETNDRFSNIRQQISVSKEGYASAAQGRFTPFTKFKVGENWFKISQGLPIKTAYMTNSYDAINLFAIFAQEKSRKGLEVKIKKPLQNTSWNSIDEEYPVLAYNVMPQCMSFSVHKDSIILNSRIDENISIRNETGIPGCSAGISYDDIEGYEIEVHAPNVFMDLVCIGAFDDGATACVGEKPDDELTPYAKVNVVWDDCAESCNDFGFVDGERKIAANVSLGTKATEFVLIASGATDFLMIYFSEPGFAWDGLGQDGSDQILLFKNSQEADSLTNFNFDAKVIFKEQINEITMADGAFDFAVENEEFDICRSTVEEQCGWYDTGEICLEEDFDSHPGDQSKWVTILSGGADDAFFKNFSSTICGDVPTVREGHYALDTHAAPGGTITVKTPEIPKAGDYFFSLRHETGTVGEDNEIFTITCNGETHSIQDSALDSEYYRVVTVPCTFNQGENFVEITSQGQGDVHLESFRIRE